MIDSGLNALTSLLGRTTTNELTNAVGKFADIGGAGSKSLLGLLGPVVMGVLGQQQSSTGRSAAGAPRLAKAEYRSGPPPWVLGLSQRDRHPRWHCRCEGGPKSRTLRGRPGQEAPWEKPVSEGGWLLPALALAALGGLAWYFLSGPTHTNTAETKVVPKPQKSKL